MPLLSIELFEMTQDASGAERRQRASRVAVNHVAVVGDGDTVAADDAAVVAAVEVELFS